MSLYDANMMLKLVGALDRTFDFTDHRNGCPAGTPPLHLCTCGLDRHKASVRSLMLEVRAWADLNR